jgi:hypothetical protein
MFLLTFTMEVFMRDPLYWAFEHFAALDDMHQQAVLSRHGINIEDVTGNTTGSPAPPEVWSTPHIEEILQTLVSDGGG